MAKKITLEEVRQRLQNCGISLRASDLKSLLDWLEDFKDNIISIDDVINVVIDVLDGRNAIYNVTALHPNDDYFSLKEAIHILPPLLRKKGLIIIFEAEENNWITKQFIGDPSTNWLDTSYWRTFGEVDGTQIIGDVVISPNEPDTTTDLWVDTSDSKFQKIDNIVISGLLSAIANLQNRLESMEYAFTHEINFGDFSNNKINDFYGKENARPDRYNVPDGIGVYNDEGEGFQEPIEYKDKVPNAKHLATKLGTYDEMIANQHNFVVGELLWCYDTEQLWIKNINYELVLIGSSSDPQPPIDPEIMEGILQETINNIKRITGIEMVDMSNKTLLYRIQVNNGKIELYDYQLDKNTLADNMQVLNTGKYYTNAYFPNLASEVGSSTSPKLYVNSVYCGGEDSNEYSYNPVSHNFVELSNLGKKDINLKGLYLHYTCKNLGRWITLPLRGVIKSQSTFLVKGAQSSIEDINTTYIKVGDPDMYWDLESTLNSYELGDTVWDDKGLIKFDTSSSFYISGAETDNYYENNILEDSSLWSSSGVIKWYIDLVGIGTYNNTDVPSERLPVPVSGKNLLLMRYYNMDLVRQATKAISARNNFNDWTYLNLDNMLVDMDVTVYTPKASKDKKNIFFNKTTIEDGAPSAVTCTFGYNAHTTRCFNWISKGYYDEYLWIRKDGDEYTESNKFESFKEGDNRAVKNNRENSLYNRIRTISTDGVPFTVHKYIIDLPEENQKYYYKVGKEGAWSEERSFTMRTRSSVIANGFNFLQVTDQQGFTENEYDMWGEAAKFIENNESFDFIINTGDIAQNGNRINEYLDYYQKGNDLLKNYEHMFCVGNNDLCLLDPYELGDGEAISKTNPVYTEYFYTFEHPIEIPRSSNGQYIASVYDFIYGDTYFLAMNSEITQNAKTLIYNENDIYNTIKTWCEARLLELDSDIKWRVSFTHDCPMTLVTADVIMLYIQSDGAGGFTKNPNTKRGGSHLNTEGNYWYSQFLQDNNFKLCIGGHKHTYTNTRLLREDPNLSMEPIVYDASTNPTWYQNLPDREKNLLQLSNDKNLNYVKYVTCQATGYKLISNKELPAQNIPWLQEYYPVSTQVENAINNTVTVTVNKAQQFPHYILWNIGSGTEAESPGDTVTSRNRILGKPWKLKQIGNNENWWYHWHTPIFSNQLEKVGGNGSTNANNNIIIEQNL